MGEGLEASRSVPAPCGQGVLRGKPCYGYMPLGGVILVFGYYG